jgi:hypothetical protein
MAGPPGPSEAVSVPLVAGAIITVYEDDPGHWRAFKPQRRILRADLQSKRSFATLEDVLTFIEKLCEGMESKLKALG